MYLAQYGTTTYIDVLQKKRKQLQSNISHWYQKNPEEVTTHDSGITKLNIQKINRATTEEEFFNIGQKKRFIKNRALFQKGTLPSWTKTVHTILSSSPHRYILDNGKAYKYYELQGITDVQKLENTTKEPTREHLVKQTSVNRKLKNENIDISNIVTNKRERKPNYKFHY